MKQIQIYQIETNTESTDLIPIESDRSYSHEI